MPDSLNEIVRRKRHGGRGRNINAEELRAIRRLCLIVNVRKHCEWRELIELRRMGIVVEVFGEVPRHLEMRGQQ
jgi:hypothetical protein